MGMYEQAEDSLHSDGFFFFFLKSIDHSLTRVNSTLSSVG